MIRALVISSLLCGALGLSVVQPTGTCLPDKFDEVLKNENGYFFGSSLRIGLETGGQQRVSWETASKRLITESYVHKKDYVKDTAQPTVQFMYAYGLEPDVEMDNGFDNVQAAGCLVKQAALSEARNTKLHATHVGGLRPHPGHSSHLLLGERAPRVSFCFPKDPSMDGRLTWGAPSPQEPGMEVLEVTGGMKAHHWAVNVTGMSMSGTDESGKSWSQSILDDHRATVAKDPKAYWIAVFSTGQATLVVPKEVLAEMKKHVDVNNLVDCTKTSHLPALTFELNTKEYTLLPKDYLAEVSSFPDKQTLQELPLHFRPKIETEPHAAEHGKCVMMFAPPTPFEGVFVLGQPFLRLYTTTYDYAERKITTVPHDGSCWSGATRSHKTFTFTFLAISIAMSLRSLF